jgi:hypothetical protein
MEEKTRKAFKFIKKSKFTEHEIQGIKELVNIPESNVIWVQDFPKVLKVHYIQKEQYNSGIDIKEYLNTINRMFGMKTIDEKGITIHSPRGFGKTTKRG